MKEYIHFDGDKNITFDLVCVDDIKQIAVIASTCEGKISVLGIYPVISAVVHRYCQQILSLQCISQFYPPGGIAAVMVGQIPAVEI